MTTTTTVDLDQARKKLESGRRDIAAQLERAGLKDEERARLVDLHQELDDALARVDAGTYGECAKCGGRIEEIRLNAIPHVAMCIGCKRKAPDRIPAPAKQGGSVEGSRETDLAQDATASSVPALTATGETAETSAPPAVEVRGAQDEGEAPAAQASVVSPVRPPSTKEFEDAKIPDLHRGGKSNMLQTVGVAKIIPAPDNHRSDVGDVSELAASIASLGLLNRISVAPNGDGTFQVIAGHRRLEALKSLGRTEAPVEVLEGLSEQERQEAMLIENLQREDLSPLEEARAFQRLIKEFDATQRSVAERIGRSQSHVSKRLTLLELPAEVQQELDSGGINVGQAENLLRLKGQPKLLTKAFKEGQRSRDFDWTVDRYVRDIESEEQLKKVKAELKAAGVKLLKDGDFDHRKGAYLGKHYGYLDVTEKKHAGEPCHAAMISRYGNHEVTYVCTDVKRHGARGESELKAKKVGDERTSGPKLSKEEQAKKAAEAEQKAQLVARQEERRSFVKTLIQASNTADGHVDLFVAALTTEGGGWFDYDMVEDIAGYLGIEVVPDDDLQRDTDPLRLALREYATTKSINRQRIMLALAIRACEELLEVHTHYAVEQWGPEMQPYFDFLEKRGYETSDIERWALEAPAVEDEEPEAAAV